MSPTATSGRTNGTVAADTSDKPFVSSPPPASPPDPLPNESTRVDEQCESPPTDNCCESGWVPPRPQEGDWDLNSREYSIQGTSREQPLFAFQCGPTAGLCLVDSGATLNLIQRDLRTEGRPRGPPLEGPQGSGPLRGTVTHPNQGGRAERSVRSHLARPGGNCRAVPNDGNGLNPGNRVGPLSKCLSHLARTSADNQASLPTRV